MFRRLADWLTLATFFALTVLFTPRSRLKSGAPEAYLNPPPEYVEHFTFGFAESMADSLWLRWIQDGGRCQMYAGGGAAAPEIDPGMEKTYFNTRHQVCDNSWSFKMLDAVTKLAPRFEMPYLAGAMTLSVLVEDYAGATEIFDRGVKAYPNDWKLLYRAGYHALFDRRDPAKAADLLTRAVENGGPYWLRFLAAKMYSRAGQATLGISTLESYLKTLTDEKQRTPVIERIQALRRELAAEGTKGP